MTLPESWMKKLPVRIPPRTSCERCVTNIWHFDTLWYIHEAIFSKASQGLGIFFALVSGSIYGRQTAHLSDDQTCFLLAWLCSDHVSLWMFNIQHCFNIVCLVWSCVYWLLTHSYVFFFMNSLVCFRPGWKRDIRRGTQREAMKLCRSARRKTVTPKARKKMARPSDRVSQNVTNHYGHLYVIIHIYTLYTL